MNNGLLYLGGLLALVLAALFGVPYFVDWNGYRGVFEEEATKVLGREVRVGGAVNVRFLPTPYVRFEKVRLADVTGRTGEPFLRAESFTMRLAVSPLLRGAFEANDIELTKPVLSLVLDGEGGGNWTSLQLKPAALPFVPANVALHAVRISDGSVLVHSAAGKPVNRLEAIQGELSADTLQGPFKFKGSASMSGETREFKLATLAADPDGALRFKASMLGQTTHNFYALDGAVHNASSKPKVTGELTGKLTLQAQRTPSADSGKTAKQPAKSEAAPKDDVAPVFLLKSTVTADARGAKFEGLELELDGAAEPQAITGTASASWGDEARFDTALAAKWIDFDALAAPVGQTASLARINQLAQAVLFAMGGSGAASTKVEIEQVKIGGDQAGGLKIDADIAGGEIRLRDIKGGLPGGARFEFAGTVKDPSGERLLEGEGAIRGVNISRVQAWLQKSGGTIDLKSDGPFWVAGHVSANDSGFKLTAAKAELAGQTMSGDVAIASKDRREVTIRIETPKLDTAAFFPGEAERIAGTLKRAFALAGAAPVEKDGKAASEAPSDFAVRVVAGELKHDGKTYRDVDARLSLEGADLRIPEARFQTANGVGVIISGSVNTADAAPKGALSYDIDAPSPDALQEAAALSGLGDLLPKARIAGMSQARISGLIRLGKRTAGTADVSFDGVLDGARISGEFAFDHGFKSWRTAPSRITASTMSPNVVQLLKALGVPSVSLNGLAPRPAEVTLAISGLFSEGAQSYGTIKAEGLDARLTGKLKHDVSEGYAFKGQASLNARDAREALALAGIPAPGGIVGTKLEGNIDIASEKGALVLHSSRMQAGANSLSGEVRLSPGAAAGASTVAANIEADRVVVAGLLGWIADREPPAGNGAQAVTYSVWPEAPFNFDAINSVNGEVRLKAGVLELAEGLAIRDSTLHFEIAPGKVVITELKGRAAGGSFATMATLEKVPGGASLDGRLSFGGDLGKLSSAASGEAAIEFQGNSRGLTPSGLISALSGKGTIALKGASEPGPAAGVVADVADAVFANKLENDAETLDGALLQALENSRAEIGTRTLPFVVTNGEAKIDAFTLAGPMGEARVATIVSLASLAIDSVWQVAATPAPLSPPPEALPDWKPQSRRQLPAIPFVYSGSISDLSQLQVKVDSKDLQRELEVRRMERKLEELDALRKRDEERQRQEIERRKALEAERAAAAAAAAAAKAQQQSGSAVTSQPVPPPVIPESGAPKEGPQTGKPETAAAPVPPPATVPADATAPKPATGAAQPIDPAAPQPGPEAAADSAAVGAEASHGTVMPARPPAPKPAQRPRRTTSDELNKAFGGWP